MKTRTVILHVKTENGTDGFNRKQYTETTKEVSGVLIAPVTDAEVLDVLNFTGKHAVYQLAIPKDNTDTWTDTQVEFFGKTWNTIGSPVIGMDENIPLRWNKKVRVELYGSESCVE